MTEEPLTIHNIYLNLGTSCSQIPNWFDVFPIHMERGGVAFIQTDCDSILDLHIISDRNWSYTFDIRTHYSSLLFDSDSY